MHIICIMNETDGISSAFNHSNPLKLTNRKTLNTYKSLMSYGTKISPTLLQVCMGAGSGWILNSMPQQPRRLYNDKVKFEINQIGSIVASRSHHGEWARGTRLGYLISPDNTISVIEKKEEITCCDSNTFCPVAKHSHFIERRRILSISHFLKYDVASWGIRNRHVFEKSFTPIRWELFY